jgi:hypothetical protein
MDDIYYVIMDLYIMYWELSNMISSLVLFQIESMISILVLI